MIFRTLYAKLAGALLSLMLVIAVGYVAVTVWSTKLYLQEANQQLHRGLAASFVSEGLIGESGDVGKPQLKEIFHTLMLVNPSIEVYLTDADGALLAYSAPPGKVMTDRIDLRPVREFLADDTGKLVLGDDPRKPGEPTVFSVAPVGKGVSPQGYLYVVLAGEPYRSAFAAFPASHVARISTSLVVGVLACAFALGLLSFGLLTRRLKRLSGRVNSFSTEPHPSDTSPSRGDELSRLEESFELMQERITDQLERIRRVDGERRRLVENISHDLRTPLASLIGHLETLAIKDSQLDTRERGQYIRIALTNGRKLSGLVDQLFELARLDAPEMTLSPEPFNLPELAQDVVQKFRVPISERNIRATIDPTPGLPFVRGDVGLVERALDNLVKNGVQHLGKNGSLTLTFRSIDPDLVIIEVADDGPGIPAESLPHLFDRFFRGESDAAGSRESHGLGLAIVKRIAELHGGSVSAANLDGGGAVFSLTLPSVN